MSSIDIKRAEESDIVDFNAYQYNAKRTESLVDTIGTNWSNLVRILEAFNLLGDVLNLYKKQMFYGSEIPQQDFIKLEVALREVLEILAANRAPNDIFSYGWFGQPRPILDTRIVHGLLGKVTEASEIGEILQKYILLGSIDLVGLQEEIGDDSWYTAIILDAMGVKLSDTLRKNIAKLKERYPEKFEMCDALERNLELERKALES